MRPAIIALCLTLSARLFADALPLLPDPQITALASELSGESAKRNLEGFSRLHRMRGSREFHRAAEQVVAESNSATTSTQESRNLAQLHVA
jgi:hypothetical protein